MRGPILLVEDDENDVFFMREAFKKAGIEQTIEVANDGREAISYIEERMRTPAELPSLIILDLKLPFVMGLDVLRCIRAELRLPTVVIVMSASAEKADVCAAYRAGANAYLVKPTDTSKLTDIVKGMDAFWLSHNVFPENAGPGVLNPGAGHGT
jgi:DNA-binding response OmpR family regulator